MRLPIGSFSMRCDLDLFARPEYAYGIQQAATLAKQLGYDAVSVIEFGVAGGCGLLAMESAAQQAQAALGVRVEVYGFDRAAGLPPPLDYRDLPYHWQPGFFEMDMAALRRRLTTAQLIIGDLAQTVPEFITRSVAPVGFVAVDVDLYSSTVDALKLFDAGSDLLLPRALCYLDDTISEDYVLQNEYVGELAAISEYNARHDNRKISPINGLVHKRLRRAAWCDAMFAFHWFDHPQYGSYIGPASVEVGQTLPLSERRLDGLRRLCGRHKRDET